MKCRWVNIALRLVCGGLFVYAGGLKLLDLQQFANDISGYRMFSSTYVQLTAFFLPPLEILCGLALIIGVLKRGGQLILMVLLLVFIAVIAQAWFRGLDISCGCFGSAEESASYVWLIARDVLLLIVLVYLFFQGGKCARENPVGIHQD